ncbi:MAG: pseudouridine synthase [Cyclobacteriaceae bacterium]|nr:pseudouridine synthase [Cyclobacteriaceae bacterium]
MPSYFYCYKPFGVLCQFTGEEPTLASLGSFPKEVYPVGRLDKDSEGLLLLSDDSWLNHQLLNPKFAHQRTYFVQVEGIPTEEALAQLRDGVTIQVEGKPYRTKPALVRVLDPAPPLPERIPPIRYRASIPDSWIALTLIEGKNRQVRKMTAAVGFLQPGECRSLSQEEAYRCLGLTGFLRSRGGPAKKR